MMITSEDKAMMVKRIKIYSLYEIDEYGRTHFRGRFASKHRLKAGAAFMNTWFYEVEEKEDEFGGTIALSI